MCPGMEICNVSRHSYICKNECMCWEFLLLHIFSYWPRVSSTSNFQNMCLHEMIRILRTEKKVLFKCISSPSSSRDDHKTAWTNKEKTLLHTTLWFPVTEAAEVFWNWADKCVCSSCFPAARSLWTRCFILIALKFSFLHYNSQSALSHLIP